MRSTYEWLSLIALAAGVTSIILIAQMPSISEEDVSAIEFVKSYGKHMETNISVLDRRVKVVEEDVRLLSIASLNQRCDLDDNILQSGYYYLKYRKEESPKIRWLSMNAGGDTVETHYSRSIPATVLYRGTWEKDWHEELPHKGEGILKATLELIDMHTNERNEDD
jgi:hypothetical protein